jgi:molybdopterin-guanine dinucleotide biosynthesis protein B
MIPVVSFVGPSGVGKTTLLEKIVREFKSRGFRVAVVKHAHCSFEIDRPGKDSWRMTQAGCDLVVVSSRRKMALIQERTTEAPLEELIVLLEGQADIVLVEGYKDSGKPTIELFRSDVCRKLPVESDELLAVVTDQRIPLGVRQFKFAEIDSIVDFIDRQVLIKKLDAGGDLQPSQSVLS